MLSAERLNELDVFRLVAGLVKDAQVGLALVEGFRGFTETTGEPIVNERVLQNLLKNSVSLNSGLHRTTYLKRIFDRELALGRLNSNLSLWGVFNCNFISSVRHTSHRRVNLVKSDP